MKRIIIALFSVLSATSMVEAQGTYPCGTGLWQEPSLEEMFPALSEDEIRELFANSYQEVVSENGTRSATYVIPVVFHVLHMYGSENVNDNDIYSLMEELNLDFGGTHPSLSTVVPPFDTRIGTMNIEFRLAALDPVGNCTNGIEHIYTHESFTGRGDDFFIPHKVGQWNRARYLNIWTMENPGDAGPGLTLLGYSHTPESVEGAYFYLDGVVLLHDVAIGDENRTAAHEIGHYLGLCHTFGCTSSGATAGDGICNPIVQTDYIDDTPPTDGQQSTCDLNFPSCDPDSIDTISNTQNIMDYSSCIVMFTEGQATWAENSLQSITGQRNQLWSDTTLMITGVKDIVVPQVPSNDTNNLTVPLCVPVADFSADEQFVCIGNTVTLTNASWNAVIGDWSWDIPGATFVGGTSATDPVVQVTFSDAGYKTVSLTANNAKGSDTKTMTNYIYVSPNWANYGGPGTNNPVVWDMEGDETDLFRINNIEDNYAKFALTPGVGVDGSKAFELNNFKDVSNADPFTSEWWYNYRLGLSVDQLITPSIDLRYATGIQVSFDWSYAANTTNVDDMTEELRIQSSADCGVTWQTRKVISGADLLTGGFAGGLDYIPTNNSLWATEQFNMTPNANYGKLKFRFQFTASDVSNNLFIDNIVISGSGNAGVDPTDVDELLLNIYPNPAHGEAINVSYVASEHPVTFTVLDMSGKVLSQETVTTTNAQVNHQLSGTAELPAACYFVEVSTNGYSATKKVVIL